MRNHLSTFLNRAKLSLNRTAAFLVGRAIALAFIWYASPWWFFVLSAIVIFARSKSWPHNLAGLYFLIVILTYISDEWLIAGIENTELVSYYNALRIIFSVILGFLFLLLLGIKELFFIKRKEICLLASAVTFFAVSFFSFWYLEPGMIMLQALPFLVASLVISSSFLRFKEGSSNYGGVFIYSLIISFLLTELLWAMLYLSPDSISASLFLSAAFLVFNLMGFKTKYGNLKIV